MNFITNIMTDKYVMLTSDQYRDACRRNLVDNSYYTWGHCGHVYYLGRIICVQETLGL